MTRILVTGGAGYIGSHTCIELLNEGYSVVVLDNLCNSKRDTVSRIEQISGKPVDFVCGDIRSRAVLDDVFREHEISAVIHFAGLKSVGESVANPLAYYDNNVTGTLTLLDAMQAAKVRTLVFSSSATVYGEPHAVPVDETFPLKPTNPYGRSKLMIEEVLGDLFSSACQGGNPWKIARLRYFNPVGAHKSGLIGEDPNGIPANLMPYIANVAIGKSSHLNVFGADYPTPDGTGVRDYIHVVDLALGHLAALDALNRNAGMITVNLGTGQGYSVLDMVRNFEEASGRAVPLEISPRRAGDVAACYADVSQAEKVLGWRAMRGVRQMCEDVWRWRMTLGLDSPGATK